MLGLEIMLYKRSACLPPSRTISIASSIRQISSQSPSAGSYASLGTPNTVLGRVGMAGRYPVVLRILTFVEQSPANMYARGAVLVLQSSSQRQPLELRHCWRNPGHSVTPSDDRHEKRIYFGYDCPPPSAFAIHGEPKELGCSLTLLGSGFTHHALNGKAFA